MAIKRKVRRKLDKRTQRLSVRRSNRQLYRMIQVMSIIGTLVIANVLFTMVGHRQRAQFINAHGGIMIFRRALYFLSRVAPRRISINDGVFFDSYSPFSPPATASRACSMRWAAMV